MRYIHILIIMLLVSMASCGNDEEFVINCEIRGLGSKGVEMYYTTRSMQRSGFHPVDGKIVLRGVASEPTLVEVFTTDGEPLFMCVAQNGDELEVKMDLEKPGVIKIKGNDASEKYARFVTENDSVLKSGDVAAINALVADEVMAHPDRISSAMLLVTRFNARGYELKADSLVNTLKPQARPSWVVGAYPGMVGEQVSSMARGTVKPITINCGQLNERDTTLRYWPSNQTYSMIVVTGTGKGDSVRTMLKELTGKLPKRRFKALEVAVMGDSAMWKLAIRRDSAKWMQGWVAGGVAGTVVRTLQIPGVPYFIVADSLGNQVYRGYSATAAGDSVKSRLARFFDSGDSDEDTGPVAESGAKDAAADKASARNAVTLPASPKKIIPRPDKQLKRMDNGQSGAAGGEHAIMKSQPQR